MATPFHSPPKSIGQQISNYDDPRLNQTEPAAYFQASAAQTAPQKHMAAPADSLPPVNAGSDDWELSSIRATAERLRSKALSPVEITARMLQRMAKLDPMLNTTISVLADTAMSAARQAEQEIMAGQYRGPLHGVPLGIKDLFAVAGTRTTSGSQILRDYVTPDDSTAVAALRRAGAIFTAKQNMHEFAFGTTSENAHYGPVRNPWDTNRNPGGSSGGTAAAIAAGLCYGGLGSDTGGSIRIPAALCGITGIKPTYGRVSRAGVLPLAWSLDHAGPLARTVEDCALLLQTIAGADPHDPSTLPVAVPDYLAALNRPDLQGVVLGVPREWFFTHLEPGVRAAVDAAFKQLESLGARLVEVSIPLLELSQTMLSPIISAEAESWHEKWRAETPEAYGPEILARLKGGQEYSAVHYVKAQRMRSLLVQEFAAALTGVDALVAPTVAVPAPPIGKADEPNFGMDQPSRPLVNRLTCPCNLTGTPAVSVPCGFSGGLPVGLQIMGRAWDEAGVLAIAQVYQRSTDWHLRRPPVA